jgi:hypothetical protein
MQFWNAWQLYIVSTEEDEVETTASIARDGC